MKSHIAIFVVLLLSLISCVDKGEEVYVRFGLQTAERLSEDLIVEVAYGKEYFGRALIVCTDRDESAYYTSYYSGTKELQDFSDWQNSLMNNVLQNCMSSICQHFYLYAGVQEGASIYADKEFCGRPAGEDLGDLFKIPYYHDNLIIRYPDFQIMYNHGDKYPQTFRELMDNNIVLTAYKQPFVILSLSNFEEESLAGINLTIKIPVMVEYYEDYAQETYKEKNLKPEGLRILKGSITLD